jgi:hypothetical protein
MASRNGADGWEVRPEEPLQERAGCIGVFSAHVLKGGVISKGSREHLGQVVVCVGRALRQWLATISVVHVRGVVWDVESKVAER